MCVCVCVFVARTRKGKTNWSPAHIFVGCFLFGALTPISNDSLQNSKRNENQTEINERQQQKKIGFFYSAITREREWRERDGDRRRERERRTDESKKRINSRRKGATAKATALVMTMLDSAVRMIDEEQQHNSLQRETKKQLVKGKEQDINDRFLR